MIQITSAHTLLHVASSDDIAKDLAKLHMIAFPGFFLTSLGIPFLQRLYAGFITEPKGICLVAHTNKTIVGFIAGTTAPDLFFRNLLKRKWISFAFASLPGLFRNPLFVARKCLGAIVYRGEIPKHITNAALLSSIAVLPTASGKGIGQMLVNAFIMEAKNHGCKAVYLITDKIDNDLVNKFYFKCGFKLLDSFTRPGKRVMNRWIIELQNGFCEKR